MTLSRSGVQRGATIWQFGTCLEARVQKELENLQFAQTGRPTQHLGLLSFG